RTFHLVRDLALDPIGGRVDQAPECPQGAVHRGWRLRLHGLHFPSGAAGRACSVTPKQIGQINSTPWSTQRGSSSAAGAARRAASTSSSTPQTGQSYTHG